MTPLYIALAAVAGAFLPAQALINAKLGAATSGPIFAAMVNFTTGTMALIAYVALTRLPLPALPQLAALPWWYWVGGVLGAFFVFTAALTVPKLGAAGLAAVVIAGQLISSMLLDHFGLLNGVHALSATRLLGALLLLAGAYLILNAGN